MANSTPDPTAGLGDATAAAAREALARPSGAERWDALRSLLTPDHPFEAHRALFAAAWRDHDPALGPPPAWSPTAEQLAGSNLGGLLAKRSFAELHAASCREPEAWWPTVLRELGVVFKHPPDRMVDLSEGAELAHWLPGARLNIAASCFEGRDPDAPAIVARREGEDGLRVLTVADLHRQASRVAWALQADGLLPGDAVAGCMPMSTESVAIYLGVVLAGGVFVSIADSFSAEEIATRLRISGASRIFTQDVIVRGGRTLALYERIVAAGAARAIVLPGAGDDLQVELRAADRTWPDLLALGSDRPYDAVPVPAESPSNVLFSSGTTGEPKAIPWNHVTPIKAAGDGYVHHDIRPGDVVAWPTNLGWMMGPWLIYAALLRGAAIALFEGLPSGAAFCRFVQDARVTMLGVVPALVRAWRAADAVAGLDWSSVRCFSSTGEASAVDDYLWLMSRVAGYRPVVEYCGGTEIGGGYICGSVAQPQSPATFSTPAFGSDFVLIDDEGQATDLGELALVPPMLGSSGRLLNRDHHAVYFAGMPPHPERGGPLRRHGDQMERLGGGYYRAHGRADDTMNLGGIKTSSAEIERAVATVAGVVESAAVAVPPPGGGPSELVVCAVLEAGADPNAMLLATRAAVRTRLNPLFRVSRLVALDALPRTASGKVMRRVLRRQLTRDE